jgi:hypothetical protein
LFFSLLCKGDIKTMATFLIGLPNPLTEKDIMISVENEGF